MLSSNFTNIFKYQGRKFEPDFSPERISNISKVIILIIFRNLLINRKEKTILKAIEYLVLKNFLSGIFQISLLIYFYILTKK